MSMVDKTISPLIINNTCLIKSSFNNIYRYTFPQGAVQLKGAKIAISNVNIYYSWFNISSSYDNNTFSIIWPTNTGTTTYNLIIPNGFYDITAINYYIQQFCIQNNLYLVNSSGQNVYYIELVKNANAYAVQLNLFPLPTSLPSGWTNPGGMTFPTTSLIPRIIINSNAFRDIIGFNAGTFPSSPQNTIYSKTSDYTPQVTPVQSVILTCSLLNNKKSNPATVLYNFTSGGAKFGSVIQSSPYFPSFVDIQDGLYSFIEISFLDQNFNPLPINDSNLVVMLLLSD